MPSQTSVYGHTWIWIFVTFLQRLEDCQFPNYWVDFISCCKRKINQFGEENYYITMHLESQLTQFPPNSHSKAMNVTTGRVVNNMTKGSDILMPFIKCKLIHIFTQSKNIENLKWVYCIAYKVRNINHNS